MTYGNDDFVPVLLGTGLNAYNVARCLHSTYGVRSLALGRAALRETAHSAIIDVRVRRDFDEPGAIMATLAALAEEFPGRKLLLLPTIEYYTNVVIDHRDKLADRYVVPLVGRALADRLIEKAAFYATCEELGIPYPRTVVVTPADRGDAAMGEGLPFPYPVIVKPSNTDIYPRLHFAGQQKVYLVDDAESVRATAELIFAAGYDDDLIVQDYIPGDESVMRVANTYSDGTGVLRFVSVGQVVLADHDPKMVGNNNAILTVDAPDVVTSLQRLLDGVGFVGTANADMMFDRRDGTSKILELNLRPGATSFYTMAAGGNLVEAVVEDVIYGKPLTLSATTKERLWLNLPYAFAVFFAPPSLRARVLKAALRTVAHTLWYWRDLAPRRLLTVIKHDVRYARSTMRFARSGLNR